VSPITAREFRRLVQRISLRAILALIVTAALVFTVDYAVFRFRAATNRNAYGSVTVNHYYAVLQKNGKTQFIFDPPQAETCVNALFPHAGLTPCWYLRRYPEQRTNI
jgi:hypothetical protein